MIYILVGADGTGKTTLCNSLKNVLDDAVFVKEGHTTSVIELRNRVAKFKHLMESGKTIIYDHATIIDDFVYSPIKNKMPSVLQDSEALDLVHSSKVTVIYLSCDVATLTERLNKRGDEYIVPEELPAIVAQYERFFKENSIDVFRIDATLTETNVLTKALAIIRKKEFKIAHIVPVQCLPKTIDKGYHMCLANIVAKNDEYAKFYTRLDTNNRAWVLMDNGAAEREQLPVSKLIECYQKVQPQEVVLPDTLLDSWDTLRKSREALKEICDFYDGAVPFTFMAVPQGTTIDEWEECAREMVQWPEIKTIGVSKFLPMHTIDLYARVRAVEILNSLIKQYNRYDMEVHLLGCYESPVIIESIHQQYSFVRGCDSAYAYICTQAGVSIHADTSRPAGEIDFINGNDYDSLEDNMQAMELEIGAYNNKFDDSWK